MKFEIFSIFQIIYDRNQCFQLFEYKSTILSETSFTEDIKMLKYRLMILSILSKGKGE